MVKAVVLEKRRVIPLYIQILIGVMLGTAVGMVLHERAAPLGEIGMLAIRLLKALATPLILFAVLDAFMRTQIPAKKGAKLLSLSLLNATVAVGIGLCVAHFLHAGDTWRGRMAEISPKPAITRASLPTRKTEAESAPTLDPLRNLSSLVPESLVEPFGKNNVIAVVLIAVLVGAALRKLKDRGTPEVLDGIQTIEEGVQAIFRVFSVILGWIILLLPFAVFGIVANVVGKTGPGVFAILGVFLGTMALGLFLHAVLYYSLLLWTVGRVSPLFFYGGALDAIITALSCSSSLATLPVTLRCLNDRLRVSPASARLAACVGTNLNHDGIILYEASAAIFMMQAFGYPLTISHQITIALASVMAGVGIAGVPEAGLITLPLVLGAAGLPASATAIIIPIILPVDWILGRCRAATNVISDMTVALLLDRLEPPAVALLAVDVPVDVPASASLGARPLEVERGTSVGEPLQH